MSVKKRKAWKWIHKWFSLVLGPMLILWAISGIVLNHRGWVSSIDVGRNLLPSEYHYKNWNLAAVRSGCQLSHDSLLIYGNIGIWLTDRYLSTTRPFMDGLPKGTDNRRTMAMIQSESGHLYAGTQSGLYVWETSSERWKKIQLPLQDERLTDLRLKDGRLVVTSRSEIFLAQNEDLMPVFQRIVLKPAAGDDGRIGLFRTLWVLHSGELFGHAGKLFVDFLAFALVFFVVTGYVYFFFPKWIRKRKRAGREVHSLVKTNRFSVKWHNKLGIWLVTFLLVTTITGMFLRPPLLIAIGNMRVVKTPFTILSDPNTWHDRLRAIHWNADVGLWLIAANDGLFYCDEHFAEPPMPFPQQPPLSVMGINVLEYQSDGHYLIGSFNGLFQWNPATGNIRDAITGEIPQLKSSASSPLGDYLISGMISLPSKKLIFDYNKGLINETILMPAELSSLPMPLWNVALEVHTARIFQAFIGIWYILIIPLFGLITLAILISGLVVWLKRK